MVSLTDVKASNSKIASALPAGLVAVFVGATSGIGEYALKQFAKYAREPRIYFVGRSQAAGDRIAAECKTINVQGEFTFIEADVSSVKIVDGVCREIKGKETTLNLLFLSQGSLDSGFQTSEDLPISLALPYYSRLRFILNLLPLLQKAQALRRVVSVFAATKEGPVDTSNLHVKDVPLMSQRGHMSSMMTLALEQLAKQSPEVSFIHDFPGFVKTGIGRRYTGVTKVLLHASTAVLGPFIFVPEDESGARHVYLATSAKYPPRRNAPGNGASGVPIGSKVEVGCGTDGEVGSGVYSVGATNETAGAKVLVILRSLRSKGVDAKVWEHTLGELKRITSAEAV